MEPKTRWRKCSFTEQVQSCLAILWEIHSEFGERKDEEVMTSSAPAVGWSEGSSHGPKRPESHPMCSGEERERLTLGRDMNGKPLVQRSFSMSFALFTLL